MSKKLRDIGEINLINYIKKSVRTKKSVVCGIGDDAAVLEYTKDKYLLFSSDMVVEGVHFARGTDFEKIGHKALACCLSDIAAMGGGVALFALVSLGVPANTSLNSIKRLYRGINKLAKKFNLAVVGGDTTRSKDIVVDVSLLGQVAQKNLLLRSNARVDDLIFVTGKLGGALKSGRHLNFMPCISEAQFLSKHIKINSMIDISDGLAVDLSRITCASKVGAVLYESRIPNNTKSINAALYDGEDFQLLFTVSLDSAKKLLRMKNKLKTPLSFIGQIIPKKFGLIRVDKLCRQKKLSIRGFRHF